MFLDNSIWVNRIYKSSIQILCLILFALSIVLTLQFYQQILPSNLNYNYCTIKKGCEKILESPFSSFLSLPVSLLASIYVLKIVTLVSLNLSRGFFISSISALISFIYLFVLFFIEKNFCYLCLSFHLLNILMTFLILRGVKNKTLFDVKYFIIMFITFFVFVFTLKQGLTEYISRIEVSDGFEVVPTSEKPAEILKFQRLLNISPDESHIVFYLDPTCKFCREHMENFLAFNRLKKMKIMIIPHVPQVNCNEVESEDSSFAACEAIRYTYCLPKEERSKFFLSLLSDQIWKYSKPADLQEALRTYYPNKDFDFNQCKKNDLTAAQIEAQTFNRDHLPSATPLIYYNNDYYLGQLEIKEFWSIFNEEK